MIMEDASVVSAPFARSSPTKRSFDVAFLTGAREDPPTQSPQAPSSPLSSASIHLSPSSLSNCSTQQSSSSLDDSTTRINLPLSYSPPSPPKQNALTEIVPSPGLHIRRRTQQDSVPTSAFTKVSRSQEMVMPRNAIDSSPLSSSSYASSTASLQAVTSFLNGNKNLAPLLASSGIFNPSLSPLFPPDRLNSNFVEEYLKTQQNIMAAKSSIESTMSPTEALSRLRSSMYAGDPYKLQFGSLGYHLPNPSNSAPPKMNTVPFISQNPVTTMIPTAINTINLASQNVCAKCNISFRMTSDLVYHMRSQHKKEQDPYKKRRNDRLKCSICGESFRERHHLTRHMTAHQDRADEPKAK